MSPTVIIVGIVMFLALIGMIACAKKQRTNPNAQPLAIALLVVVIACGVTIMFKTGSFGDSTQGIIENETKFACSKAEVLGKYLTSKFGGEKVLVVADRDYEKNERTKRLIESLKAGLGAGTDVEVDTIAIARKANMPPEEEFMMPVEEMMTAKDFDALVNSHQDCKLIVSMIGLPRDAKEMNLWKKSDRPNVALLNGDIHSMKGAIQKGLIVAVVSYKPGIKYTEDPAPSDPQKAFDMRYLLITPDNVEKLSKEYKLFQ